MGLNFYKTELEVFMLRKLFFMGLILLISLTSCKKEKGEVVAKVDGINITKQELEIQTPEGFKGDPRVANEILNQYANEVLLYKAAKDEGFLKREDLKAQIKVTTIKVVSQYYLNEKLQNVNVTEDEVNQELQKTKPYFSKKIDMLVLYYSDPSKASQYKQLLYNPYPVIVSEVNKLNPQEVQVAPLSENLGVIYYVYGEDLFKIINNLKVGEISEPVPLRQTGYYALIKILNIQNTQVNENDIKDFLHKTLTSIKQSQMRDSILTALQNKYKISEVKGK
jgi:hypothetical protein